ncbi:hypothetical protein ACFYNZ_10220 [Streptomyces kebangsaanensis]|uniref:ATP-binding protein n=1 Tax=Streptomyces kebangsaanensis TaxID=864058 RepID=A0ABW6KPP4_9ACTN
MARSGGTVVLRDVLDIKEDVYAGDFKVELSQGFSGRSAGRVEEYVVTPQLREEFDKALKLVRGAVRKDASYAAYLHGSFGAGKTSFLMVGLGPELCRDTAVVLLTWIAEVADEPLVLEPADRRVEWETNTWSLGAADEDRSSLSATEVVAAFERTASAIRERIRGLGLPGAATFYVWHDEQAGQLRCSTGSVPPDALPFSGTYVASDDLGPIVEGFLADSEPGFIGWSDLKDVQSHSEQTKTKSEITPFHVWVSSVGASH